MRRARQIAMLGSPHMGAGRVAVFPGRGALAALLAIAAGGCELFTDFGPLDRGDGGDSPVEDFVGDEGPDPGDGAVNCSEASCPSRMVYVPCGQFLMGSDPGEGDAPDEEPEHVVSLSAFCIDANEVTNGDYAGCVAAAGCAPPHSPASATRASYFGAPEYADYPVLQVDWAQARTYCDWRGKALPTEAQWEKAARGGCELVAPSTCGPEDERSFPWGEGPPACDSANHAGCVNDTDRVGARPAGSSPYSILDMSGNAAEWTSDWYSATAYASCSPSCTDPAGPASGGSHAIRGGSWDYAPDNLRLTNRFDQVPAFSGDRVGFRCAASIP